MMKATSSCSASDRYARYLHLDLVASKFYILLINVNLASTPMEQLFKGQI